MTSPLPKAAEEAAASMASALQEALKGYDSGTLMQRPGKTLGKIC